MRKIVAIAIIAILVAISLGVGVAQAWGSDSNIAPIWYTTTMTLTIERTDWGGEPLEPVVLKERRLYKRVDDALFWVTPGTPRPLLILELVGENTWECRPYVWEAMNPITGEVAKYVMVAPVTMTFRDDEIRTTGEADVYVLRETKHKSGVYNWEGFMHYNLEGTAPLGTPAKP